MQPNLQTPPASLSDLTSASATTKTFAAGVSWIFQDTFVNELLASGVKVRVKKTSIAEKSPAMSDYAEAEMKTTEVIFSKSGRGGMPGRRLAIIETAIIDSPVLTELYEQLKLTVFGPQRTLFHRERLFSGGVASKSELLEKMSSLLASQI